MSIAQYSILSQSVSVYNYLIDIIEDFLNKEVNTESQDIINAANNAKNKLQQYYSSANGLVYVIAISIYIIDICLLIINLILIILFI